MRALAGARDPIGFGLAVATGILIFAMREGPVVAVAGAVAVLGFRIVAGLAAERLTTPRTASLLPGAARSKWYAPLTPREAEVALHVSEGLTNREIAQRLVISERGVDTHVQNAFNKLTIHDRTQLGVWIIQRRMASENDKPPVRPTK